MVVFGNCKKKEGRCLDLKSDQDFIHIAPASVFKAFLIKNMHFVHYPWVLSHDLMANLRNSLMVVFGNCKKKEGRCLDLKSDQDCIHIAPASVFKAFLIKNMHFVHFAWVLSHDLIANLHNSLISVLSNWKKEEAKYLDK
jgi:hypothetical protein